MHFEGSTSKATLRKDALRKGGGTAHSKYHLKQYHFGTALQRLSLQRITCGKDFIQLSGEDASAIGYNAQGGVGAISVTANVAPKLYAEFQAATLAGDYALALEYQDRLMPLHDAIFLEPGLAGAKYGLSLLGKCSEDVRLPLVGLTDGVKSQIRAAMVHAGLIN